MGKQNPKWVNLVFCIDSSGSMYPTREDVVGGYNKIIDEQKANEDGKVTVSLYTFSDNVTEHYVGKDINDIPEFKYNPDGMTALNDGVGIAIQNVGKWLYEIDSKGEEMPGVTMFVCMTDGHENYSKEYSLKQVQDMIKEQTDKYGWQFIYEGCDITTTKTADSMGFKFKTYTSRNKIANNYDVINCATKLYRGMASTGASIADTLSFMESSLNEATAKNTADYEKDLGFKLSST